MHVALSWVGPQSHRAALAAFFVGDFFLGRDAGNYFAKALLPTTARHGIQLRTVGGQPSRICVLCWHFHRDLHLEDESHVLFNCPAYSRQRCDFMTDIKVRTRSSARSEEQKLSTILSSDCGADWEAFGRYLARIRQVRRKTKTDFIRLNDKVSNQSFDAQRRTWRQLGKFVCRHGVFFDSRVPVRCPCLQPALERDWAHARLMSAIDNELKCIVTDSFCQHEFTRIGLMQAEIRRRGW